MELFSQAGSRNYARDSALPDLEPEQMMTVTSGRNLSGSLTKLSPIGFVAKTLLESLAWKINPAYTGMYMLKWKAVKLPAFQRLTTMKQYTYDKANCSSEVSVKVLKKEDMKCKRLLYRLQLSKRPIKGNGYGLLPTVDASLATGGKVHNQEVSITGKRPNGTKAQMSLNDHVRRGMIPTVQTQGLKQCDANGKTQYMNLSLLPTPVIYDTATDMELLDKRRAKQKSKGINGNGFGPSLNELAVKNLLPTPTSALSGRYAEAKHISGESIRKSPSIATLAAQNLLPTPTSSTGGSEPKGKTGRKVVTVVNQLLPTPSATEAEKAWEGNNQNSLTRMIKRKEMMPTPAAQDGKNSTFPASLRSRDTVIGSIMEEAEDASTTSQLNPLFVAEMMGFPPDWTILPFQNGAMKV